MKHFALPIQYNVRILAQMYSEVRVTFMTCEK
jgi:hypothetical protein